MDAHTVEVLRVMVAISATVSFVASVVLLCLIVLQRREDKRK